MSMHKKSLTEMERKGLEAHGLPIGTASQCSDSFRNGISWCMSQISHLENQLKVMTECAQESQGWDWLAAQERAMEMGHDNYEIPFMQELHDIAFGDQK